MAGACSTSNRAVSVPALPNVSRAAPGQEIARPAGQVAAIQSEGDRSVQHEERLRSS